MKFVSVLEGVAKATIVIACTDVAQAFTNAQLQNANGALPIMAKVSAEGNNIRYGYGGVVITQGNDGSGALGHVLYGAQNITIYNTRNIQDFRFINQTNGNNAYIQVTMYYTIGD